MPKLVRDRKEAGIFSRHVSVPGSSITSQPFRVVGVFPWPLQTVTVMGLTGCWPHIDLPSTTILQWVTALLPWPQECSQAIQSRYWHRQDSKGNFTLKTTAFLLDLVESCSHITDVISPQPLQCPTTFCVFLFHCHIFLYDFHCDFVAWGWHNSISNNLPSVTSFALRKLWVYN